MSGDFLTPYGDVSPIELNGNKELITVEVKREP